MKKKNLFTLIVFVFMISLSLSASALDISIRDFESNSTYTPVSYSGHESVSEVTLYGNADYLCMKAFKDADENESFWLNIYSDSKRTNKIMQYSTTYKKGTKYDDILVILTGLKSKTYYATAGVHKLHRYGYYTDDPSTIIKFKITVKRDGTDIKKMKTIMYGYENSAAGPVIYWFSVPGSTKYEVYKKQGSKWKKFKTVKALGLDLSFCVDESLKGKNATAYYKVKAVNGTGKTPLSDQALTVNAVKAPEITLTANPKGGIKISWKKVADNARYYIYMSTPNSEWKEIADTAKTSYVYDYILKTGTTYYFTVVAKTAKGTSGPSYEKSIVYFNNPKIKSIEEKEGNFVISWESVKGAQTYNIYRKVNDAQEWEKIGSSKALSFTDKNSGKKNTLYTYCVRSVRGTAECVYGAPSQSKAIIDTPVLKSVKANREGYPVISWEPVENATYSVYRKLEGATVWSSLGKTKSLSFTDKNKTIVKIENGDKYIYSVCACIGSQLSEHSENAISFIWYMPVKLSLVPGQDCIGIKWEEAKNVDSYNVYRKNVDSTFTLIGNTASEYFEDTTAVKEVRYTYKVVGVVNGKEIGKTAAEISAKLSSKYVTASIKTFKEDSMYCWIKPSSFNSETKYTVYTKIDGVWKSVNTHITYEDIFFEKNESSFKNVYAIGSVSPDGTITSACDKNAFTLNYIVPTKVTAKPNHSNYTATISWTPIDGAEKYNIYCSGEKIATVKATNTSYKTGKLATDKYIYFSVGVVYGKTEYTSDCSVFIIKKPTVAVKNTSKGINISWDTMYYNYTVYRKSSSDGNWKALKKVRKNSYTDTNVENGKTYYYTVAAEGGAKNEKGTKITFVKPVTMSKAVLGKAYIELKWKKSSVADYYLIYKYTDGKWKKVYRTEDGKTVKYVDKDVKAGKKHSYRVYAVKNGIKSAYSSYSVVFVAPPAAVKATAVKDGIKLSFNKVSGAKKYVIYRKAANGEYEKIKSLNSSKLTYTDKNAKKGVKYTYYVKAYNGILFSAASSKVSVKK